jgi:hypothetical protein
MKQLRLASLLALAGHLALTGPVAAQHVTTDKLELSFGVTFNALEDVNARPQCAQLGVPCTRDTMSRTSPEIGVSLSVARNFARGLALVGESSVFGNQWDSPQSLQHHRSEYAAVKALLGGGRVSTRFFDPFGRKDRGMRVFAQVLGGGAVSPVVPLGPAVQTGVGFDGVSGGRFAFRMSLDYRAAPRHGRDLSGWRSLIGVTIGPHVAGSHQRRAGARTR